MVGTAQYTTSVPGSGLNASAYFDMRWQSRSYVGGSAVISPNFVQDPYALVDARFALGPPEGGWQIELWARNLFDQHAWSVLNNTTLQPGSISGCVIEPRSYGITTSVKW